MSALTNAILKQYPQVLGHAQAPVEVVVVRGEVTRESDPLWRESDPLWGAGREDRRITKRLPVDDLPLTVIRWLALGRTITGITGIEQTGVAL